MPRSRRLRSATAKPLRLKHSDCTYFLCPDSACDLFTKPDGPVPCERTCLHRAKKAIVCHACRTTIVLPSDHFSWERVDCPHCTGVNFQRMSGRYRRHNLAPAAKA